MNPKVQVGRRPPTSLGLKTSEEVVDYLRDLAERLGKDTLSTREVNADGQISAATICRRFGAFSDLLIKAGLKPRRVYKRDPEQMLSALRELMLRIGRSPSLTEFKQNLSYSPHQYKAEFGSLDKACESARPVPVGTATSQNPPPSPFESELHKSQVRRRYGPVLDFRGLRHEPINEQGVVFLFGMLAAELGFVVESIQGGFPDCDAKLRRKDGTFEGVRIEFEFKSSEFLRHKHDPSGCDFIVCWIHDWADCPLPVLELSKEVRNSGRPESAQQAAATDG
jgi:hypothetical protein